MLNTQGHWCDPTGGATSQALSNLTHPIATPPTPSNSLQTGQVQVDVDQVPVQVETGQMLPPPPVLLADPCTDLLCLKSSMPPPAPVASVPQHTTTIFSTPDPILPPSSVPQISSAGFPQPTYSSVFSGHSWSSKPMPPTKPLAVTLILQPWILHPSIIHSIPMPLAPTNSPTHLVVAIVHDWDLVAVPPKRLAYYQFPPTQPATPPYQAAQPTLPPPPPPPPVASDLPAQQLAPPPHPSAKQRNWLKEVHIVEGRTHSSSIEKCNALYPTTDTTTRSPGGAKSLAVWQIALRQKSCTSAFK